MPVVLLVKSTLKQQLVVLAHDTTMALALPNVPEVVFLVLNHLLLHQLMLVVLVKVPLVSVQHLHTPQVVPTVNQLPLSVLVLHLAQAQLLLHQLSSMLLMPTMTVFFLLENSTVLAID